MLTSLMITFIYLEMVSIISCSVTFPEIEGEVDRPVVPGFSCLPFLETVVTLAFFQSSRTSPDCNNLSERIESGLAMTWASFHSTHGGKKVNVIHNVTKEKERSHGVGLNLERSFPISAIL